MLDEFAEKFKQAYDIRFDESDIDWKPTYKTDRATGQKTKGTPLAYLNWATAWRTFKKIYPEGTVKVIEQPNGDPLWVVNGYGMVKVEATVCGGISHTEIFPIMQGGQNDAMPIVDIDGRDINDAIQRASVKAMARFGIGLYIYEGKLDYKAPVAQKDVPQANPQRTEYAKAASDMRGADPTAPQPRPANPASQKQKDLISRMLLEREISIEEMGYDSIDALNSFQASDLLDRLFKMPKPKKEEKKDDDEFPF